MITHSRRIRIESRSGWNWNMFPEEKGVKTEEEYDGHSMGEINCLPDGTIKSIYSHEINMSKEESIAQFECTPYVNRLLWYNRKERDNNT